MQLKCRIEISPEGLKRWFPLPDQKGFPEDIPVFLITSKGEKQDLRLHPPFWQILPCPDCGIERGMHFSEKHIDPRLGEKIDGFK